MMLVFHLKYHHGSFEEIQLHEKATHLVDNVSVRYDTCMLMEHTIPNRQKVLGLIVLQIQSKQICRLGMVGVHATPGVCGSDHQLCSFVFVHWLLAFSPLVRFCF